MQNLFRHPTGHSRLHGVYLACEVLKLIQHDVIGEAYNSFIQIFLK
jgi:hypothetical protein